MQGLVRKTHEFGVWGLEGKSGCSDSTDSEVVRLSFTGRRGAEFRVGRRRGIGGGLGLGVRG